VLAEHVSPRARLSGWLVMSRLAGSPLFGVAMEAAPAEREALFRSLGEALNRLHALRVPPELREPGTWRARQLEAARGNLGWCDGTAADLVELEASQPEPVPETLIHGDLALDNVLIDSDGTISFIDWAGAGSGDPRHDIALALENEPEFTLTPAALAAFYAGYGSAPVDDRTCNWFSRLYNYF
jgi:aminoglycoside phosphotransferase (APT) family kinase protein